MTLTPTCLVVQRPGVLEARAGGTHVVLNEALAYSGLGGVGPVVWDMLDPESSIQDLVDRLVAAYDVAPQQCLADVLEFVDALQSRGLVDVRRPG